MSNAQSRLDQNGNSEIIPNSSTDVGLMPVGIAHDLNNLFTVMLLNVEMLNEQAELSLFSRERIDEILVSARKASQLNEQILNSHTRRSSPLVTEDVDLGELIRGSRSVLAALAGKSRLEFQYACFTLPINVVNLHVEQIMMNLIANAAEASADEAIIHVRTGCEEIIDREQDQDLFGARTSGGQFCYVEVEDCGCGLGEQCRDQIFDQGFSKSRSGQGIGLAVVLNLVNDFNGLIRVNSSLGCGTNFRILIPQT